MVNTFSILKPILRGIMKLAGMSQRRVQIEPGTAINFWVPTGATTKPVLLFLHGFAGDGITTWLFQVLPFSRKYAIYVPDLLFFGESVTCRPDRSPEFQAEYLAKGLKILGVERCRSCIGFSYGGIVGFKLAEKYPELIESLVLSSTVMELTETISNGALERTGSSCWSEFLLPETVEGVRRLIAMGSHQFPKFPDFLLRHFLEAMYSNRKERGELLDALIVKDEDAMLPTYPKRILILWGNRDNIFNLEDVYKMESWGRNATLEVVENAGHSLQSEMPSIYNSCLIKFFASLNIN